MQLKWLLLLCSSSVFALPQDPVMVNREASISLHSPEVMEIIASENAVIEWKDFSIDTRETVRFSQPSPEAVVLNRVIGSEMSQIFGKLEANGKVLLINPNGVLFGKEARIDTGSFIASTLDLQGDFFAKNKKLQFEGTSTAQIINLGSIVARGGDLALIASDINQQGHLNAFNGSVALIGSTYSQDFECRFPDESGSWITHSGQITSPAGRIHLMANEIYVFGTSEITTSSPYSGGEILIGAGLQGKDPSFTNAQLIWVEEGAQLLADSWEQGNGGRVILFSDAMTDFSGHISAQGGKLGGDGGFAEVSGHSLSYRGFANLRSPLEKAGTLLLDPTDITITGAMTSLATPLFPSFFFSCMGANCLGSTCAGSSGVSTRFTPNVGFPSSNLSIAALNAQLMAAPCANVVIDSTGAGLGFGTITWLAGNDLVYTSTCNLVLSASGTVTISSNVQNRGTGSVVINSTGAVVDILGTSQPVSFGSAFGPTIICAPSATVNVTGVVSGGARVGYNNANLPAVGANTGPISVCCNVLNVVGGGGGFGNQLAQIGHGFDDILVPVAMATTPLATIDVIASNSILLSSGLSAGLIGHGPFRQDTGCDLEGDISVTCNGLDVGPIAAMRVVVSFGNYAQIGFPSPGIDSLSTTAIGSVRVHVPRGSLSIEEAPGGYAAIIGHGQEVGLFSALDGDVEVCCGVDLRMIAATGLAFLQVGHAMAGTASVGVPLPMYTGHTLVTVGQDVIMTGGPGAFSGNIQIGFNQNGTTPPGTQLTFTTQVIAGRNIRLTPPTAPMTFLIGNINNIHPLTNTKTFVMAGNDIFANVFGYITANGDVAIAAGGNINLTAPFVVGPLQVGTQNTPATLSSQVKICAGGSIIGTNTPPNFTSLGSIASPATPPNFSVDIRAGGDIQIPYHIATVGTGSIFIEADTFLLPGAMWSYAGGVLTSICGLPSIPVCLPPFPCLSPLIGATAVNSPPATPDGFGCLSFAVPPGFLQVNLGPVTGNVTLHSASQPGGCDLRIGGQPGDNVLLNIAGSTGNIEVFGTQIPGQCPRRDSFRNVTINQDICTTGSVLISANNNLTMAPGSSIGGPACGANIPSSVTLIVDNQAPIRPLIGPGGFFMDATAVINSTGPVRIFTALQNINVINGLINGQSFAGLGLPGTPFICTNEEIWCSYFCDITCPMSGVPFTIAYKNCLQQATQQAMVIIDQFLVDLHPYNEYPGWMMRFWIDYADPYILTLYPEPYMLRRRHLNVINHPKSWAQLVEDIHPRPLDYNNPLF